MKTRILIKDYIFIPTKESEKPPWLAKMYNISYCESKPCANYK
jgi:hypothetical protein